MARNYARILTSVDEPTWVYHAYCEHGGLLYVGISRDVAERIKAHRRKRWWRDVADVFAYLYPSRRHALDVESHAIHTFRPANNIVGQASVAAMPHEIAPHAAVSFDMFSPKGRRR